MPRAKISRKSTVVDMTAMCDVAFLLLSFFILVAKPKPPGALNVITPTSVSSDRVKEKNVVLITDPVQPPHGTELARERGI